MRHFAALPPPALVALLSATLRATVQQCHDYDADKAHSDENTSARVPTDAIVAALTTLRHNSLSRGTALRRCLMAKYGDDAEPGWRRL